MFKNICKWLLPIVVTYSIENWTKLFRNQIGLLFLLKHKITLFYLLSFIFIRFITRCHSLSLIVIFVTRCHSLSLVFSRWNFLPLAVPLVLTRCHLLYHSLSLFVICCATRCHSLSSLSFVAPLVVILGHSLSFVVTRCTTHLSFYKRSNVSVSLSLKSA